MITLDRLLDGLDVELEPLPGEAIRSRRASWAVRDGFAVLEIEGGTTIRRSPHRLTIEPPSRQARTGADWERSRVVTASVRIRVTYDRSSGLFDDLSEPLAEDLGPDDPIQRSFEALLDGLAGLRPGCRAMAEALTLRLERAADLLARTDLPVKAVAAQVGYSSRSAFTRAFATRHGTGPTTFRMATRRRVVHAGAASSVADAA